MAEVTRYKGGGYITFDESDWKAGYLAQGGQGTGSILKGNGLKWALTFDPYRANGFASPGFQPTNATNMAQVTGAVTATVVKNASLLYGVSTDGKVQEFDYTTNTITNGATFPRTIAHGAHTGKAGSDVIIYRHNSGGSPVSSLFYSFYDNTDWDVGAYVNFTGTPDDDFMSTVPATPLGTTAADLTDGKLLPHPMEIGADDILYMGSGRYLHGYDGATGTNGTFSRNLVTLPQGFIIQDLLKTEQYLLIAGVFSSSVSISDFQSNINFCQEAVVYLWDYVTTGDITDVIHLDDQYVSVIGMWRNRPFVVTGGEKGNRGRNRVKIILGTNAQTVAEYDGSQPSLGGYDSASDQLLINSAGRIYGIGSPYRNDTYEVNYLMAATVTTASGFVKNIFHGGQKLFASAGADFVQLNGGFAQDARMETGFIEPVFGTGKKGRIKGVTIIFRNSYASTAARGFALTLTLDNDSNSVVPFSISAVAAGSLLQRTRVDTAGANFPQFFNLSAQMDWTSGNGSTNAAQVSKVIVEYEEGDFVTT